MTFLRLSEPADPASPPGVQVNEAVGQAGDEVLIVVAGAQDQVAVDGEDAQRVQERHLLGDGLVRPGELVQDGPVQTVVDGVQGEILGPPFGLGKGENTEKSSTLQVMTWKMNNVNGLV